MAKRTKAEALKTRQELIETAIAQFAQHGVSKTTLNDIADAANVTRGAIYWHFENKTQLFNEMWLQQPSLRELIQEHLTAGLEHDPFQQLREKLIVGNNNSNDNSYLPDNHHPHSLRLHGQSKPDH